MKIALKAYAKINLMLDILSRLENGYHDLYMIMQSVSLYDEITVTKTDSKDITITCSIDSIPTDEKNPDLVSVDAANKTAFESLVPDAKLAGTVTESGRYVIRSKEELNIIDIEATELLNAWKGAIPCLLKSVD